MTGRRHGVDLDDEESINLMETNEVTDTTPIEIDPTTKARRIGEIMEIIIIEGILEGTLEGILTIEAEGEISVDTR